MLLLMSSSSSRLCPIPGIGVNAGSFPSHLVLPAFEIASQASLDAKGEPSLLARLYGDLLALFEAKPGDRVVVPLLKTFDLLLSNELITERPIAGIGAAESGEEGQDESKSSSASLPCVVPDKLLRLIELELRNCKHIPKIMAGAKVIIAALQFGGATRTNALGQALRLLGHRYPKVRKTAAESLYVRLMAFDDLLPGGGSAGGGDEENADRILEMLTELDWSSGDATMVRGSRDELFKLFGLEPPKLKKKTGAAKAKAKPEADEMASYAALFRETGR